MFENLEILTLKKYLEEKIRKSDIAQIQWRMQMNFLKSRIKEKYQKIMTTNKFKLIYKLE
jgi:hypothetical protein